MYKNINSIQKQDGSLRRLKKFNISKEMKSLANVDLQLTKNPIQRNLGFFSKAFDKVKSGVSNAASSVKSAANKAASSIKSNVKKVANGAKKAVVKFKAGVKSSIKGSKFVGKTLAHWINGKGKNIKAVAKVGLKKLVNTKVGLKIKGNVKKLSKMAGSLKSKATKVTGKVTAGVKSAVNKAKAGAKDSWSSWANKAKAGLSKLNKGVKNAKTNIKNTTGKVRAGVKKVKVSVKNAAAKVKAGAKNSWSSWANKAKAGLSKLNKGVKNAKANVKNVAGKVRAGVKNSAAKVKAGANNSWNSWANKAKVGLSKLENTKGSATLNKLKAGIVKAAGNVMANVKNSAGKFNAGIKELKGKLRKAKVNIRVKHTKLPVKSEKHLAVRAKIPRTTNFHVNAHTNSTSKPVSSADMTKVSSLNVLKVPMKTYHARNIKHQATLEALDMKRNAAVAAGNKVNLGILKMVANAQAYAKRLRAAAKRAEDTSVRGKKMNVLWKRIVTGVSISQVKALTGVKVPKSHVKLQKRPQNSRGATKITIKRSKNVKLTPTQKAQNLELAIDHHMVGPNTKLKGGSTNATIKISKNVKRTAAQKAQNLELAIDHHMVGPNTKLKSDLTNATIKTSKNVKRIPAQKASKKVEGKSTTPPKKPKVTVKKVSKAHFVGQKGQVPTIKKSNRRLQKVKIASTKMTNASQGLDMMKSVNILRSSLTNARNQLSLQTTNIQKAHDSAKANNTQAGKLLGEEQTSKKVVIAANSVVRAQQKSTLKIRSDKKSNFPTLPEEIDSIKL